MTDQKFALLVTSLSHLFGLLEAWNPQKVSNDKLPMNMLTNKVLLRRASMVEAVFARKWDIRMDPCVLGCQLEECGLIGPKLG